MTAMMTEVETIRLAATRLRERANTARAGRWVANDCEIHAEWADGDRYVGVCDGSLPDGNVANAEHIAALDPTVALAMAELLDTEAEYDDTDGGQFPKPSERRRAALTFVRAYLRVPG